MTCPKCGMEYNDSFRYCPNCAEANPMSIKEEPIIVSEPPRFPVAGPEQPHQQVLIKKEEPPRKNLSESIEPVFAKIKEKTNKKTIIIGASVLVLIVAVIVLAVVLTRPSYPATFKLGDIKQGDLSIKGLTLTKGAKEGSFVHYELSGTALGKWNGNATINLNTITSKGMEKQKFELTIKRNDEQELKNLTYQTRDSTVLLVAPIQKCEVQSVSYDGKMNTDDFVSIDNVTSGLTLTAGASVIAGTVKEDGSTVTFNGQPVQIGPDKKFTVTTTINEGSNTLTFDVTEKGGAKATKTITLTGQIPPAVYKASCPAGPPYAVLNKNPDAYKGQRCQYRGKVVQAMESGGTTDLRVDITSGSYGIWSDTIYVTLAGTTPAVTDSIVAIYGTIAGSYTYTSTANYKITLPRIDAKYVDVQ